MSYKGVVNINGYQYRTSLTKEKIFNPLFENFFNEVSKYGFEIEMKEEDGDVQSFAGSFTPKTFLEIIISNPKTKERYWMQITASQTKIFEEIQFNMSSIYDPIYFRHEEEKYLRVFLNKCLSPINLTHQLT